MTTTPTLLFTEGAAAPADLGGRCTSIAHASLEDGGELALSVELSGAAAAGALLLRSPDGLRTLLRAGEAAPGGGRYARFSDLDLSSCPTAGGWYRQLLFRAKLEGGSSPEGLFLWTEDGVREIALAGARSPRGRNFRSFARPTLVAATLRSSPGFLLAYEADLESGERAVVVHPSYAEPLETLATGDRVGEEEVTSLTLSRLGGCLAALVGLRGKDGETAGELTFIKHGQTIYGLGLRQGTEFPSRGKVEKIAGPPAIGLQVAFVAVELAGGQSALATSDILGNAQIFARSGDVSPDLPEDPIASFGPPIANAAFPLPGRLGLAAPVRLQSGRSALWSADFSAVLPLSGRHRLLPLEEDMECVKLTNRGMLLLRCGADGGRGRRWMALENLF